MAEPIASREKVQEPQRAGHSAQRLPAAASAYAPGAAGNLAMQRLLREGVVQAKLEVSEPGDVYEQEADRIAAKLTYRKEESNKASPVPKSPASGAPSIGMQVLQDKGSGGADEEMIGGAPTRIQSPSSGRPLPDDMRQEMESVLRADLSNVRVHDSAIDRADADRLHAKAFTYRQDIWIGSAGSANDSKLMAHELAHTVRWRAGAPKAGTRIYRWDNPSDDIERPGPNELYSALEDDNADAALHVLRANVGPLMPRLREEYGRSFFRDLDRVLRQHDRWGEGRALLRSVLILDEEIRTLEGILSSNQTAIFRVLGEVDDEEALRIFEAYGLQLPAGPLLGIIQGPRARLEDVQAALRRALGADEYTRAMRLLLAKAERGRARLRERQGALVFQLPTESGEPGLPLEIVDELSRARVDLVWSLMVGADTRAGFTGPTPSSSRALLALTDLRGGERRAMLARIRSRHWAQFGPEVVSDLIRVAEEADDARAVALALERATFHERTSDLLGLEIASERAGELVAGARAERAAGTRGTEEVERLEGLFHERKRLESIWRSSPHWEAIMERMHVGAGTIGVFKLRGARSFEEVVDALRSMPPEARTEVVILDPRGRAAIERLNLNAEQQEVLNAWLALEQPLVLIPRDAPPPQAIVSAQQMLEATRRGRVHEVFAVLRGLSPEEREALPRTGPYATLRRELRAGDVTQWALLSNIEDAVRGNLQEAVRRQAFSLVVRGGEVVQEIRSPELYAELLSLENAGRRDDLRRGFVLWQRLQRYPDLEVSEEDRRLAAEYARHRELTAELPSAQRRRLDDVLLGAPQLLETPERPLDPNVEADYMRYRLAEQLGVRQGTVGPWSWVTQDLEEASTAFSTLYDSVRPGGVDRLQLAELAVLYHRAMSMAEAYGEENRNFARDMASVVGCVVATAVVTVASGGTLTPVAVGALAAFFGGSAAAVTGAALRAENRPEEMMRDFSIGAVEGALAVAGGALASRVVRGAQVVGRGAGATARAAGGSATRTAGASRAAALAESMIDGMVGGAGGELFQNATDEVLWEQETSAIFAALLAAILRGATLGAGGGVVGHGVGLGIGALARRYGSHSADDVLRAFERAGLTERLGGMDDVAQDAVFRARALHVEGNDEMAARVLADSAGLGDRDARRVLSALRERSLLLRRAATELDRTIDDAAAAGLTLELGVDVRIDPSLSRDVLVDYRLGAWGSPNALSIRVGPAASVGDVRLHSVVLREIRAYEAHARTFQGFFERANAWLRGQSDVLPRAREVLSELEKHGLMIEARQSALRGRALDRRTEALLTRDIDELNGWVARFQQELGALGAPEGIIGTRLWPESFSQVQLEQLLDVPGAGFQRAAHPSTGQLIREPGFSYGQPLDMGRRRAFYARRLEATFPDIYGVEVATGRRMAMELKTLPSEDSVASYLGRPSVREELQQELGGRRLHLPLGTPNYLVLDIRQSGQSIQSAIDDLRTVMPRYIGTDRRPLWDGLRFITGPRNAPVLSPVYPNP